MIEQLGPHALDAAVTAAVGIVMFLLAVFVLERVVPFSVLRSVGLKMNSAVGIIVLSVLVGLGIILSATLKPGN